MAPGCKCEKRSDRSISLEVPGSATVDQNTGQELHMFSYFQAETKVGDTQARRGIGLLMFLYSLIVSVVYISSLQNPLFHEVKL